MGRGKGDDMKVFLISLVIVVIGAAGALYYIQRQRISDLDAKNASLTTQLKTLKSSQTPSESGTSDQNPSLEESQSYTSEKGVKVIVTSPARGATVASPLTVAGQVPGSWSFEAQFSVRLVDAQGNILDEAPATVQGDWMTSNLVPFTATLNFGDSASKNGTLVLIRSNPSDLRENDDTVVVPILL